MILCTGTALADESQFLELSTFCPMPKADIENQPTEQGKHHAASHRTHVVGSGDTAGVPDVPLIFKGVSHFVTDPHDHSTYWLGNTPNDGSACSFIVTGNDAKPANWQMTVETTGGSAWFVATFMRNADNVFAFTNKDSSVPTGTGATSVSFNAADFGFNDASLVNIQFVDFGNGSPYTDKVTSVTINGVPAVPYVTEDPIVYCAPESVIPK
jgi:hypothetical protein